MVLYNIGCLYLGLLFFGQITRKREKGRGILLKRGGGALGGFVFLIKSIPSLTQKTLIFTMFLSLIFTIFTITSLDYGTLGAVECNMEHTELWSLSISCLLIVICFIYNYLPPALSLCWDLQPPFSLIFSSIFWGLKKFFKFRLVMACKRCIMGL